MLLNAVTKVTKQDINSGCPEKKSELLRYHKYLPLNQTSGSKDMTSFFKSFQIETYLKKVLLYLCNYRSDKGGSRRGSADPPCFGQNRVVTVTSKIL